ncbi:MAG: VWA domain-containing protein [Planctomycetota bacterium]
MNGKTEQTILEFARASSIEGWWWWALLVTSLAAVLYACVRFYRRDTHELTVPVRVTLIFLRLVTIAALVFFFFDFQRRTQREISRASEVVVLVDTSQSMSLTESDQVGSMTRSERVVELLGKSELADRLSQEHRLSIYRFGEASEPLLLETRGGEGAASVEDNAAEVKEAASSFSAVAAGGLILIVIALVLSVVSLVVGAAGAVRPNEAPRHGLGYLLASTAVALVVGLILSGSVYSYHTTRSYASLIGLSGPNESTATDEEAPDEAEETEQSIRVLNWEEAIAASAAQSRIGDALTSVLAAHDPTTLAGVIVLTDGQNNGGKSVSSATATARRNEVAIYPVGLGSSQPPVNVRVVDLDAPRRVYPNDKFAISAVLQGTGGSDLEVSIQLLDGLDASATEGGDPSALPTNVIDSKTVTIPGDGTLSGIKFELEPASVGRRRLAIRVIPPKQDQNEKDNIRDARYEVVSRKLRVLTIAGGPTREYRFVRNLFYRDQSIQLDTWLQTGQAGMSQDADKMLKQFPETAAELFEYDAIAMFDPDWTAFSAESLELLDRWVATQAGGLVLIGGPVYHPRWLRLRTDPRTNVIAGFFPVTFSSRGLGINSGREGGQTAWPPEFTPEARRADFLWVTDDPATSFEAWESFGGVYDYVGAKSAKPVAKVYARFSDPTTQIGDSLPVYLASQFYGAGRVYFQGSGEMWRMRRESVSYFDSYYVKLIRWVCEGRLLRDSNRGVLLVDNSRAMIGDTITIRAVLTDEQFEPLTEPEVRAKLLAPSGKISDVRLTPIQGESRPGTYGGRFVVREAGNYELRLTLGDALDEQLLRQSVQVRLPTVELERPQRNDRELSELASVTGGDYIPLTAERGNDELTDQLVETIRPQPQSSVLPGTPDPIFTERRNASLLWLIASVLTMEWVVRRLHRLA